MINIPIQNESLRYPSSMAGFNKYLSAMYPQLSNITPSNTAEVFLDPLLDNSYVDGTAVNRSVDLFKQEELRLPVDALVNDDMLYDYVISDKKINQMKSEQKDKVVDEFGAKSYTNDKLVIEGIQNAYKEQNKYTYSPIVVQK